MPNHLHPPLATLKIFGRTINFGCGLLGHDPGCARLPLEANCAEVLFGKNKGKFLCIHPVAVAKGKGPAAKRRKATKRTRKARR